MRKGEHRSVHPFPRSSSAPFLWLPLMFLSGSLSLDTGNGIWPLVRDLRLDAKIPVNGPASFAEFLVITDPRNATFLLCTQIQSTDFHQGGCNKYRTRLGTMKNPSGSSIQCARSHISPLGQLNTTRPAALSNHLSAASSTTTFVPIVSLIQNQSRNPHKIKAENA